ncbi:hypothetical protein K7X08_028572 [Anisodus acutangulus]|uniref:Uncharacterized protein n=1 Tax=Anisodus acutangulus TaxID=402998 RepID=A0A9Q1RE30_9SOLA|nr:hypothetical protein K7X08_028572 [Anisodus acutangulus]
MDDHIYFLSKLTLLSPVKMIFAKSPAINGNSSCWLKNEQITPIVVPWGWVLSIMLLLHGVLLYSSLTIVLDPLVALNLQNFCGC